ncbi:MAG: F0F1 ATP synthase subunit delta [Alphaproteobacteria bacterium]|nr:F0F1 ATP synthase subunit delta [Alphaproteobacteria bacterium]
MANDTQGQAGIAERYASALYELADQNKVLDQVADDLRALRAMMAESDDLTRVVRSPVISREDQAKGLAAVLDKAGAQDLVKKFVGTVAMNRRLFALDAMIKAFLAELAKRRGEVTAEVTSAVPLSDAQVAAVTDALKGALGAKIAVEQKTDAALIGGMVVRVGSRLIDFSIRTKLQRLQHAMKGVG